MVNLDFARMGPNKPRKVGLASELEPQEKVCKEARGPSGLE